MKVTELNSFVKSSKRLILAVDVCKDGLDYYSELETDITKSVAVTNSIEGSIKNSTKEIEAHLKELEQFVSKAGYQGLHVVCEPTGFYSTKLLSVARNLGHTTAYVSGESVHKYQVIESNDTGKTDPKDARVIFLLAKMQKTLVHRQLEGEYKQLRGLSAFYDTVQTKIVSLKCKFHALLQRLFPDYSFQKDFLYSNSGRALIKKYKCNPYRIVKTGKKRFWNMMKKMCPKINHKTLDRLFDDATFSVKHQIDEGEQLMMEYELEVMWEEYQMHERRKAEIKEKMSALYQVLLDKGEMVPLADEKFLSAFRIARILAETGRISDFKDIRQLWKYGGLNLRERKSGKYVGQVKLSKKGRSRIRNVLGEVAFKLVRRREIYGDYYQKKKAEGMAGTKAIAVVERKILKAFFGMAKQRSGFDEQRIFCCESQYKKAG